MNYINKIRKLSLAIFIIPTLTINVCLYIVIYIKLAPGDGLGAPTFPYIDEMVVLPLVEPLEFFLHT